MCSLVRHLILGLLLMLLSMTLSLAQDSSSTGDEDGSSEQVEESDEAFRRRMELEDARRQDPSYTDPVDTYKKNLEKIDKLPEESRDNIRDQLIDVIVENGEWEPKDALEEYPYEPTEAAQADPDLAAQEQEAWDEQIEKYHEREAAAFGAYRGPVPGPGNPTGQEGGSQGGEGSQQGQGQEGGEAGSGAGGAQGEGGGAGSAGTYEPYQPNRNGSEDEVSTAGVSESALDFLKGRQGQPPSGQAGGAGQPQQPAPAQQEEGQAQAPEAQAQMAEAQQEQVDSAQENSEQSTGQQSGQEQIDFETRGIIPIEDLDKLEGAVIPVEPEEPETP